MFRPLWKLSGPALTRLYRSKLLATEGPRNGMVPTRRGLLDIAWPGP
jgi:hypothetical protein